MKTQRKRLAAVLLSATLTLSNLAGILPQSSVLAAEESVQTEMTQAESGSSEAQQASAPAEAAQPAPAPAEAAQPAPAPAEAAQPAPAQAEASQPAPAPAEEPAAAAPAESVSTPEPAAAETPTAPQQESAAPSESQPAQNSADTQQSASNGKLTEKEGQTAGNAGTVTVYYAAAEGGSVSSASEIVQASSGAQAAGSEAKAAEGFVFKNWTAADGTVVSTSAFFAPQIPSTTNGGNYTYTAHFEKAAEAPATKMVTVEYVAGNGGTVDRNSETVDVLSADAALLGSTATAQEGYQFVDWTASDDSIVSSNASFVPALSADMPEKTVYIANFKKADTMPAQDFEGSVSGVHVNVHADEGRFPEGTTMHLAPVPKASILNNDSVQDAVGEDKEVVDAIAVDITFQDKDGKEIEPAGTISVNMSTSRDVSGDSHQVLHIDDNGNASQVTDASAEGASFEASEFSIYVITGADKPAIATYKFYDANGNVISDSIQKVKNGETVYAPTTPEKSGYKFVGWSYTEGATEIQTETGDPGDVDKFNASVSSTGDVKLYPAFQQVYYVFFMDNHNPRRVSTTKEGVNGTVIKVSDVTIPLDSTHSVTGWYTDPEQTTKVVDSVKLSDHNVTLYPKVEVGHYLYFYSGEGASYVKPEFVAANDTTVEPDVPKRPGYTFGHWSATEDGDAYTFGNTITEDTTLYAVWNANSDTKYTVIYWWENANDDNYSYHESSPATGKTGSKIDLTKINKRYDGFTLNNKKTDPANKDITIAGDGSTIVNIYYSRIIYTIKFYKYGGGWSSYSWNEMADLRITAKYGASISDQWPTSTSKIWGTTKGWRQGDKPFQSGISTMPLNGAAFYYVEQSGIYTMNLNYYVEGLDGNNKLDHTDSFKSDNFEWYTTAEDHYDIEGFTYTGNVKDGSKFGKKSRYVYEVNFNYSRKTYYINFVNGDLKTSLAYKYEEDISEVDLTAEL